MRKYEAKRVRWNAYDIVFRAARFKDGKRVVKANSTINGKKAHTNFPITGTIKDAVSQM